MLSMYLGKYLGSKVFFHRPLCPPALCTECAVEGATDVKAILAIDCAAVGKYQTNVM